MANFDDNIQQAARKRLGLAGAINGTGDTSQAIYRPKAPDSGIAALNSISDLRAGRNPDDATNDPALNQENQQRNLAGAVSLSNPQTTAYSRGQATGQAIGAGANYAGGLLKRAAQATFQPAMSIAQPVAQFTRGLVGADPDKPLLNPISSAAAATPTTAPAPAIPGTVAPTAQPSIAAPPLQRVQNTDYGNPDSAAGYSAYGPPDNTAAKAATLARTPTFQQGADAITRNQAVLSRDTGFNMDPTYQAGQQAKSDLTSILNKDPRSAGGIAARNAEVDAQSGFGNARQRNATYQQALGGLVGQVGENYRGATQNANEIQRGQNTLDAEAVRGQNELANTNARSIAEFNRPQYETGADGNLVRVTGTNAEAVTGADKNPLSVMGKINAPLERAHAEIYNRSLARYLDANMSQDKAQEQAQADADAYKPPGSKGGVAPAPKGDQKFQEGQIYRDKDGNKAKFVSGKWEPME